MPSRYQRGSVKLSGSKAKVWYGMFREDVRTPEGGTVRRLRKVRLGTLAELPTKNAARNHLADLMSRSAASPEMTFEELVGRWERAEGVTIKATTLSHYKNALNAYVLPTFKDKKIASITREDVQMFLAEQATKYSTSSLRSMRVVLNLTLGWANDCGWLERNPCIRIKLPRKTGGRSVTRSVFTAEQVNAIAEKLEEPYSTLVLFLYSTGLRIGEAIALKWSDFDGNVLNVTRRIYEGDVDSVKTAKSERSLPIDPTLMERLRNLGNGEWVFRSRTETPINPGNARRRYLKPVIKELGLTIGGWHDFRHTITTTMRRSGVHPVVVSGILGQSKVNIAMDVYDRATLEDFKAPLASIVSGLLPSVTKIGSSA